ncbi:nitronate monooxygenase [Acidovorax sp. 100]|nr:nitronate monooxygenase [Acidovorax sp. 100]
MLHSMRIDGSRDEWWAGLRAPIVVAPMYMVTTARLVLEAGAAGAVAVLPAHNLASSAEFDSALHDMAVAIRAFGPGQFAPWGINLVAHASNPRFADDLTIVASHRCPLVVTSVGSPRPVMDAVRAYGGRVWCDVISIEHARKAAAAGVDGLVLVCAGAGGNTGWINPIAFVKEVRKFYTGVVAVAGAITDGAQAYSLQLLGADLAYIGTPFIATDESAAANEYKDAVANGSLDDLVLSKAASGIPANLMTASLKRLGLDPANAPSLNVGSWSDSAAWSAGHGIASAGPRQSTRQLVEQMIREYVAASSSVGPVL